MVRTASSTRFFAGLLIAGAAAALVAALVFLSPSGAASGVGPAGGAPTPTVTPVSDLEGVHCMDIWFDVSNPARTKGDPHFVTDIRSGKVMTRVEPSGQPGEWAITSVAYTGPGDFIPTGPPSDEDCKTKEDDNSLVSGVDLQPVDNERPNAIGQVVQKGNEQNLEWVICQQEDFGTGDVWVRSEFVIVVDGVPATQDFGMLIAYVDVAPPGDPQDPFDTSCGASGGPFITTLEVTQRVATKAAPQGGVADDWDGDGCSDWNELSADPASGGLRDPFNPYDFYDVNGDGQVSLTLDILPVLVRWTPNPQQPYAAIYDRGLTLGPNAWNKEGPDGQISLTFDILGVILQWLHNCN